MAALEIDEKLLSEKRGHDFIRKALVIVDVQPEFWSKCDPVRADFPSFPKKCSETIKVCREHGLLIIWIRANYTPQDSLWLTYCGKLREKRINGPNVEIQYSLDEWESFAEPQPHEKVFIKNSWDATTSTPLNEILQENDIQTVFVCGLITSVCVQHTAHGIFEKGFEVVLVKDACADRGKERHDAALMLYENYMYATLDSEELPSHLSTQDKTRKLLKS